MQTLRDFMRQEPLWLLRLIDSPSFVPVCFAVYLGLRFALVAWVPIQQHSDELWYYNRAVAVAAGQGYSEHQVLTAYWPVGWPGFLGIVFWLVGPSLFAAQMVNLLCSAAIFVLTFRLGTVLFRDELVGRLSVLILTIYPNQIAYVPILGTELFYTALLLFAVDLLISSGGWWRLVACGIAFGIATLTKAQTLFLPAALFLVWWAVSENQRRSFRQLGRAAVVYATMAAAILPWTVRNYFVFGELVPISTNGGLVLLTGNNPSADGGFTPNDSLVKEVPRGVKQQVAADHLANSLALSWIGQHPAAAIALIPKKIWRLWAVDGEAEWAYEAGYNHYDEYWILFRTIRAVNQAYYAAVIFLMVTSVFYWHRRAGISLPEWMTGYVVILYTTLISVIFYGFSRYHFPAIPWIAMYAAWATVQSVGFTWLSDRSAARTRAAG